MQVLGRAESSWEQVLQVEIFVFSHPNVTGFFSQWVGLQEWNVGVEERLRGNLWCNPHRQNTTIIFLGNGRFQIQLLTLFLWMQITCAG